MKSISPCVIWFTGLSGAGKTSLAYAVEKQLNVLGLKTSLLDGDIVRKELCSDLSFSQQDREENIRRVGKLARQLFEKNHIVLCAFISPFKKSRDSVRALFKQGEFIEVFVDTPLSVCESRDVKGLYKKARAGQILEFTGIDSPYDIPQSPEIHIDYIQENDLESVTRSVINYILNLK